MLGLKYLYHPTICRLEHYNQNSAMNETTNLSDHYYLPWIHCLVQLSKCDSRDYHASVGVSCTKLKKSSCLTDRKTKVALHKLADQVQLLAMYIYY